MASRENKSVVREMRKTHESDDDFIDGVMSYINKNYKNDETRSFKLSAIKKFILDNDLLKNKDKARSIGDTSLRKQLRDSLAKKDFPDKIDIPETDVLKLLGLEASYDPDEMLAFLLLVSGRRINEFLEGSFTKKGSKVFIDKLSKKRDIAPPNKEGYQIETLVPAGAFMKVYKRYKKNNSTKTNEAARSSVNKILRTIVSVPLNSRMLRPLYVGLIKEKYSENNPANVIRKALHHEDNSTSVYYNDLFNVKPSPKSELLRASIPSLKRRLAISPKGGGLKTNKINSLNKKTLVESLLNGYTQDLVDKKKV